MIHNVFSIYDEKAQAFLPPFVLPKTAMAVRTFSDCVNSSDHQFSLHPQDYTLFNLGIWDDETGEYTIDQKKALHNGVELIERQQLNGQLDIEEITLQGEET